MTPRLRRWIAVFVVAAMMPMSAIASMCATHCAHGMASASMAAEPPAAADVSASAATDPAGGTAAALCEFAAAMPIPQCAVEPALVMPGHAAPERPGTVAVPAEPQPPPEPPGTLAAHA